MNRTIARTLLADFGRQLGGKMRVNVNLGLLSPREVIDRLNREIIRILQLADVKQRLEGQGYELVERPLIRQDETMKIQENMHLACHPVLLTDRYFMTNTDNYLIGPQGPLPCLHQTPKEIIEVD